MLELKNITKVAGAETHIHPTNLVLERGSLNVLLGPTLSGKTSLMRLMAGLDKPTSGSVWFDGKDVTGVRVQDRGVAMVYQQFINYPALTVYENIASPMRIKGADTATIDREVRKAADLLKLTPYLDRTPLNLSGGQQQRTALARAIVKNASLVLLDEPLANLDYKLREELRLELPKIFAASGAIFVYATTEPSEALLLGGNTAALAEGRITQFGRTIDVYRRPNDLLTARTFADPPLNTMQVLKTGDRFEIGGKPVLPVPAHLSALPDGPCTIAFHPHHLALTSQHPASASLQVRTAISEIAGSESFIHIEFEGSRWVMLSPGIHDIEPDAVIAVHVDTRHLMAFGTDGRAIAEPAAAAA
ncbi:MULTISPECIES: ABC transporter ATP-binding protein [unclassified Shinella]|jgi:glycerol transport system ATP-binding protein|uniref:ABC transporter ATP-binding protein n=2 Tax=Shinella TaxID=323620 RepID=UPI0003C54882|nr:MULTISPECIES: ABC transporter ATP-binding protein [unclassified Shinella]MCA0341464.1 ABC transporter ATP-binding protein [Pseudomonadota bacterium]EYR79624.1 sn-glycerol-3-phosphate import ATP-binding protein UgpC [Shinella sp. DD12]MCO5152408.1 ABC transporter ATP-binding protein [Shinella sp.]MDC7263803.1 ABC transporter ATP-binding protein [Shinella sp. HY16]MDC7270699.1 ABC transporter ATP-binding protein [Shinella sp. YZ44]